MADLWLFDVSEHKYVTSFHIGNAFPCSKTRNHEQKPSQLLSNTMSNPPNSSSDAPPAREAAGVGLDVSRPTQVRARGGARGRGRGGRGRRSKEDWNRECDRRSQVAQASRRSKSARGRGARRGGQGSRRRGTGRGASSVAQNAGARQRVTRPPISVGPRGGAAGVGTVASDSGQTPVVPQRPTAVRSRSNSDETTGTAPTRVGTRWTISSDNSTESTYGDDGPIHVRGSIVNIDEFTQLVGGCKVTSDPGAAPVGVIAALFSVAAQFASAQAGGRHVATYGCAPGWVTADRHEQVLHDVGLGVAHDVGAVDPKQCVHTTAEECKRETVAIFGPGWKGGLSTALSQGHADNAFLALVGPGVVSVRDGDTVLVSVGSDTVQVAYSPWALGKTSAGGALFKRKTKLGFTGIGVCSVARVVGRPRLTPGSIYRTIMGEGQINHGPNSYSVWGLDLPMRAANASALSRVGRKGGELTDMLALRTAALEFHDSDSPSAVADAQGCDAVGVGLVESGKLLWLPYRRIVSAIHFGVTWAPALILGVSTAFVVARLAPKAGSLLRALVLEVLHGGRLRANAIGVLGDALPSTVSVYTEGRSRAVAEMGEAIVSVSKTFNSHSFPGVFVAAALEESVKRVSPSMKFLLIWVEFFGYVRILPTLPYACTRLGVVGLHYRWAQQDYPTAVIEHSVYNSVITLLTKAIGHKDVFQTQISRYTKVVAEDPLVAVDYEMFKMEELISAYWEAIGKFQASASIVNVIPVEWAGIGALLGGLAWVAGGSVALKTVMVATSEELLRRCGPVGLVHSIILAIELVGHGDLRTLAMHCACYGMPFIPAVVLHSSWNAVAERPGNLSHTLWHMLQGDEVLKEGYPGVCIDEAHDVWPSDLSLHAKVSQPKLEDRGRCKPRTAVWPVGPTVEWTVPLVFRSCYHNEYAAVCSRVCKPGIPWDVPVSELEDHFRVWSEAYKLSVGLGFAGPTLGHVEADLPGWLARYPVSQREKLILAYVDASGRRLNRYDRKLKSFMKIERLPSSTLASAKSVKKPRLIQGRSDAVKTLTGPWFWKMGKRLAEVWNGGHQLFYASGVTAEELGLWATAAEAEGLVPVCNDFVAFDSSVGPGAHKTWGRQVSASGAPSVVQSIVKRRVKTPTKGTTKYRVKYSKLAQVSSGDGDTSTGNTFIHGVGWVWVMDRLKVPRSAWRVMMLGDDSVMAIQPRYATALRLRGPALWLELGFKIGEELCTGWDDASFCSGYFWRVEAGVRVFGPDPRRVLSKTFWSVIEWRPSKQIKWLRGVAMGLVLDTAFVPILSDLIPAILRDLGDGPEIVRKEMWVQVHADQIHGQHEAAFQQLSIITGMSTDVLAGLADEASRSKHNTVFRGESWREFLGAN